MRRNSVTSRSDTVARWNMVGVREGSMRKTVPHASKRRNRSSTEVASARAVIWRNCPPMASWKNSGPFCVVMRLTSQLSRGTTQWMDEGSAPDCSSQMHASMAVLPAPSTTKRLGSGRACGPWLRAHRPGRAFGGTRSTPSATLKRGTCVEGTGGL